MEMKRMAESHPNTGKSGTKTQVSLFSSSFFALQHRGPGAIVGDDGTA
jgi:hypothetical protein